MAVNTYDELANLARIRQQNFGQMSYQDILNAASQYQTNAQAYRKKLAESLQQTGQQTFTSANPNILEDLNARGLMSSPTEVAAAQAKVLGDIATRNQDELLGFDIDTFNATRGMEDAALNARLNSEQAAIDQQTQLEQAKIQQDVANANAEAERKLAEELAKRESRNQLTSSLLGLGGNLGASALLGGKLGFGTAAKTGATTSMYSPTNLNPGGLGSTLGGTSPGLMSSSLGWLGGLMGGGYSGQYAAKLTGRNTNEAKAGSLIGAGLGSAAGSLFGPGGTVIGGTLGGLAGGLQTKALQGIGKQTGLNKPVNKAVSSIKKAFCFSANTPVEMADGTEKRIRDIQLWDKTRGGEVISTRVSVVPSGSRYKYGANDAVVTVTGTHAVKEGGKWIRVENSAWAQPLADGGIVYSIVTTDHRIFIRGTEFADEMELDEYEDVTMDQSLKELNARERLAVEA